jgi:DNA (cytosine-5)-methyltransferase 1
MPNPENQHLLLNICQGSPVQPGDEHHKGAKVNKSPAPLRLGSLFSGIGGLDLGLEMSLGCRPVFFCEQDPFCRAVLSSRSQGPHLYEDVRSIGLSDPLPAIDVLCGGFPCTDISHAGKMAGLAGARSGLWFEMLRVIGLTRPAYVVIENVSALLNFGLGTVLQGLHEHGYAAEWQVIEALSVGALHIRARVFIVAYPDTTFAPTIFHPNCLSMEYIFKEHRSRVWGKEPHGVSRTVTRDEMLPRQRRARLKALGNAVVQQAAEVVGMAIAESIINPVITVQGRALGPVADVPKFPKSGMSRNGFVFETKPLYTSQEKWAWHEAQRGPLVDLARGLTPTPTVGDASSSGSRNTPSSKAHAGATLTDVARGDGGRGRGLVPTPTRADGDGGPGAAPNLQGSPNLKTVVTTHAGIVPTPRASDHRSGKTSEATANKNARPLCEIIGNRPSERSGHLNPEWVEWLMGFPLGWTDVPVPPTPPRQRRK